MSSISPKLSATQLRIHHVGIAVRNTEVARQFYENLGLTLFQEKVIPEEQVKVTFLQAGESLLELLQPIEKDSHVERFLDRYGEGMHHLAFAVQNINVTFEEMKAKGLRIIHEEIRIAATGHRYFFIHPSCTGGILMEIVETIHT